LGRIDETSDPGSGPRLGEGPPVSYVVEAAGGEVAAAGMMTPPNPLVLSRAAPDAVSALITHLQATGVAPSGVTAPEPTVGEFADAWCAASGCGQRLVFGLRLFRLDRVVPPRAPSGEFRTATAGDAELLVPWAEAFFAEIGEGRDRDYCAAEIARRTALGRVFVWCDPEPVSMAGWAGPTPNGARVNFVYTPPPFRGRGYASACVAALSQGLLDSGRRFTCLFTDLGNPTSNRIYQAIGYRAVSDFRHVRFGKQEG
jgi:uncharacterized protein